MKVRGMGLGVVAGFLGILSANGQAEKLPDGLYSVRVYSEELRHVQSLLLENEDAFETISLFEVTDIERKWSGALGDDMVDWREQEEPEEGMETLVLAEFDRLLVVGRKLESVQLGSLPDLVSREVRVDRDDEGKAIGIDLHVESNYLLNDMLVLAVVEGEKVMGRVQRVDHNNREKGLCRIHIDVGERPSVELEKLHETMRLFLLRLRSS